MSLTLRKTQHPHYSKHGYHAFREWVGKQHASVEVIYKGLVGVFGVTVIIAGIILIPLPGPGWLVVFFGLAILGLEFPAAHRLNMWVKAKFQTAWSRVRHRKTNPEK